MTVLVDHASLIMKGLWITVQLTVYGILATVVVAFAVGLARLSEHRWLRWPAIAFTEVFRGTSLVVQLFWFFYALPYLGVYLNPMVAAVLVLGLNEGAYAAEIVRSAIASRPVGQTEASVALGIRPRHRLWRILIPQSIPIMLPSFGNVGVDLLKATSLVSLVTVYDLTQRVTAIQQSVGGQTGVLFGALLVLYFALSMLLALLVRALESRFSLDRSVIRRRGLFVDRAQVSV
ncbi:MAG TPA: ectoine/hydroxyectoine ABC transporter permease subunit EhuC [Microlunatus sp.]